MSDSSEQKELQDLAVPVGASSAPLSLRNVAKNQSRVRSWGFSNLTSGLPPTTANH